MRVVAILPAYPPTSRVGAFLATHALLEAVARHGHHVDVYRKSPGSRYTLDGVHVHPAEQPDLEGADLVVFHTGDVETAARLADQPVPTVGVVHSHRDDTLERLRNVALAAFNSHATQTEVGWDGPQIVCRPPLREDTRATPGTRVTLVNLSEPKGGDLFWRLAHALPARLFLGVRSYGRQIEGNLANVTVIDATPDMASVYSETRILLMPSEQESWGMVGVEAIANGIPVIAHPTAGLKESLGDAPLWVDRSDPQGWVDAIEHLHGPGWTEASERAQARAQELDTTADTERFVRALEQLCA